MRRELIRTAAFVRAMRRLAKRSAQRPVDIDSTLAMLQEDAFDPRLKTHKLRGQFDGVWACSAGYDLRIIFEFVQHEGLEAVLLLTAGNHDEVY